MNGQMDYYFKEQKGKIEDSLSRSTFFGITPLLLLLGVLGLFLLLSEENFFSCCGLFLTLFSFTMSVG